MAELEGKLYHKNAFPGGDNTLEFELPKMDRRGGEYKSGFQIAAEGFELVDATIEFLPDGSDDLAEAQTQPGATSVAVYAEDFFVNRLIIGGLEAGEYFITVKPLEPCNC